MLVTSIVVNSIGLSDSFPFGGTSWLVFNTLASLRMRVAHIKSFVTLYLRHAFHGFAANSPAEKLHSGDTAGIEYILGDFSEATTHALRILFPHIKKPPVDSPIRSIYSLLPTLAQLPNLSAYSEKTGSTQQSIVRTARLDGLETNGDDASTLWRLAIRLDAAA